jgi:3-phosphoshikimate 1-carboxyvinyltransferase
VSADRASAPVIAIDGPTASGKGTVAQRVAGALGWHYLDSGALYRLVALAAIRSGLGLEASDEPVLAAQAAGLAAEFRGDRILLAGDDVTEAIRAEAVGGAASRIAVMPAVREALVARQRGFRRAPGLVADGRDMGTVIFPDSRLKIFLTASAEARAERRHKQLIEKGFSAMLDDLLRDLKERDHRDATRDIAPLVPAEDALTIDCTSLDIDETVERVLAAWRSRAQR